MLFKAEIKKRHPIAEFWAVVKGLFLRDCKKKFGAYKFGIVFSVLEPIVHILTFTLILSKGVSTAEEFAKIPYFVMSGLIPFLIFRNTVKGVVSATKSNKPAFSFPIVKPIHAVASKVVFDFFVYSLSFSVIFILLVSAGVYPDAPFNAVLALVVLLSSSALGMGVGMSLMVLREFIPSIEKTVNIILRPLYFMSGIFYSISVVPAEYRFLFEYNPCFHLIELFRLAITGAPPFYGDYLYVIKVILIANLVGFFLYLKFEDKLRS